MIPRHSFPVTTINAKNALRPQRNVGLLRTQRLAWTAPTLAGTKLYARDRKTIVAFEPGS
jgi:hypothetical protein